MLNLVFKNGRLSTFEMAFDIDLEPINSVEAVG